MSKLAELHTRRPPPHARATRHALALRLRKSACSGRHCAAYRRAKQLTERELLPRAPDGRAPDRRAREPQHNSGDGDRREREHALGLLSQITEKTRLIEAKTLAIEKKERQLEALRKQLELSQRSSY
jgi:hypothetical protein